MGLGRRPLFSVDKRCRREGSIWYLSSKGAVSAARLLQDGLDAQTPETIGDRIRGLANPLQGFVKSGDQGREGLQSDAHRGEERVRAPSQGRGGVVAIVAGGLGGLGCRGSLGEGRGRAGITGQHRLELQVGAGQRRGRGLHLRLCSSRCNYQGQPPQRGAEGRGAGQRARPEGVEHRARARARVHEIGRRRGYRCSACDFHHVGVLRGHRLPHGAVPERPRTRPMLELLHEAPEQRVRCVLPALMKGEVHVRSRLLWQDSEQGGGRNFLCQGMQACVAEDGSSPRDPRGEAMIGTKKAAGIKIRVRGADDGASFARKVPHRTAGTGSPSRLDRSSNLALSISSITTEQMTRAQRRWCSR